MLRLPSSLPRFELLSKEGSLPMTVRESIHQLVDILPEERLSSALDYLEEMNDDEQLAPESETALAEGLDDIRNGRTTTLEELRRKHKL